MFGSQQDSSIISTPGQSHLNQTRIQIHRQRSMQVCHRQVGSLQLLYTKLCSNYSPYQLALISLPLEPRPSLAYLGCNCVPKASPSSGINSMCSRFSRKGSHCRHRKLLPIGSSLSPLPLSRLPFHTSRGQEPRPLGVAMLASTQQHYGPVIHKSASLVPFCFWNPCFSCCRKKSKQLKMKIGRRV